VPLVADADLKAASAGLRQEATGREELVETLSSARLVVHTTTQPQHEMDYCVLQHAVLGHCVDIQLLALRDQPLLIWRNALPVLDLLLDVLDRVGRIDAQRD
jgi:hypothetical protein